MERNSVVYKLAFILLLPALCHAGGRTYSIVDIANQDEAEYNEKAINEELQTLYSEKEDKSSTQFSAQAPYRISGLDDPKESERIAYAFMVCIDDLWSNKKDVDQQYPYTRVHAIEDISNPDKSEENTQKMNEMLDDLWREKVDK